MMPTLGVVLVAFNSADVILDALESLLAASGVRLAIVVVDNASTDGTPDLLRDWASGRPAYVAPPELPFHLSACPKPIPLLAGADPRPHDGHSVILLEPGVNGGFAAGVNHGLAYLVRQPDVDRFWILNPDSAVPPGTPEALAEEPTPPGGFSLLGHRVLYLNPPDQIQSDGGRIRRWTGVTGGVGLGSRHQTTSPPDPASLDFVTGSSMVASREFVEQAGPIPESYFLYYEEVDWALRRGTLPISYCERAIVYHRAGTAIGSPTLRRPASPFSLYFLHRGRIRFLRRHFPWALPTGLVYSVAKASQLLVKGFPFEAWTVLAASFGLPPPASVRGRLSPQAQAIAFSRR